MRKTLLFAVSLLCAMPMTAQLSEFGVVFGGSKRIVERESPAPGEALISEGFSFSNSSVDLYYAIPLEPATMFKLRAGRINGPVAFRERLGEGAFIRRDREGEVQHLEGIVEYRFSESFGSTGIFAGVGIYRTQADGFDSKTDYGFPVGITADFPMSRRYGVILDATYHITKADFSPRYLTVGAGLRIAF